MHIDYSAQPDSMVPPSTSLHADPRGLAQRLDEVDRHIARIESGLERPDGLSLSALKLQRAGLRQDVDRQRRKAEHGCCNCGKGCAR